MSVINTTSDIRQSDIKLFWPTAAAVRYWDYPIWPRPEPNQIFILHSGGPGVVGQGFVSIFNATTDKLEPPLLPVGFDATDIVATNADAPRLYVSNCANNTISVINTTTYKTSDIPVGICPKKMAYDAATNTIYIINAGTSSYAGVPTLEVTVSVIDASSDKVQAGIIFKISPPNSGKIICDGREYPTNIYLYVDSRTYCTAQPSGGSLFNSWVESLPENRNSSIPLNSSGGLTVNRFGTVYSQF